MMCSSPISTQMTKETLSPKINEIWSEPNTDDNDDEDEINDIVYIFDDDSTLSPDIDQLDRYEWRLSLPK